MKNLKKLFSVACHIKTTRHYLKKPAALCDVLLSKRSSIVCIKISYIKYYKTRKLYIGTNVCSCNCSFASDKHVSNE